MGVFVPGFACATTFSPEIPTTATALLFDHTTTTTLSILHIQLSHLYSTLAPTYSLR